MFTYSVLENELIRLRALEPSDIDVLYSWENNTENWLISSTVVPFSRNILEQYILNSHEDIFSAKQLRLIITDKFRNNKIVGAIDLFDFDPLHKRAGIGILIDPQERGKGFGFLALEQLKVYCFSVLHVHQLYANILSSNTISLSLFQKCNFEIIGTKKDWVYSPYGWFDECLLQCIKT